VSCVGAWRRGRLGSVLRWLHAVLRCCRDQSKWHEMAAHFAAVGVVRFPHCAHQSYELLVMGDLSGAFVRVTGVVTTPPPSYVCQDAVSECEAWSRMGLCSG
jgi:hypothetical protein